MDFRILDLVIMEGDICEVQFWEEEGEWKSPKFNWNEKSEPEGEPLKFEIGD